MIGIVGGVGPYAGLDLVRKVYDYTAASCDQEHLDTVMISMPSSIADRTAFLQSKTAVNPAYAIADVLKKMAGIGVTVAGIPCNTAHAEAIFTVIENELNSINSKLKLLNMIEETVNYIAEHYPDISRIGVLSTTGTYQSGIYRRLLTKRGFQAIEPPPELQEKYIHPAIYSPDYGIKSFSNPVTRRAMDNLRHGLAYLEKQQAQAVILGCSEISLAISQKSVAGMRTIDPTAILARALIKNYRRQT